MITSISLFSTRRPAQGILDGGNHLGASDGNVLIKGLGWVHPKKITFWGSLTSRVLTEEEPIHGLEPPPFKFVYHRWRARSCYDTQAGIMRVCAWMYLLKNYAVKGWMGFAEVYGMPLRVDKYEPGASKADRRGADPYRNIRALPRRLRMRK